MDHVTISGNASKARIEAEGGRLASLEIDGLEVLVAEQPKATRWGSFPMIPWCGRLNSAMLHFDGVDHDFPVTSAPHANHGFTHLRTWSVAAVDEHAAVLDCELIEPWPFGGRVEQSFVMQDETLTVSVSVTAGAASMPIMAGWHPWFRRRLAIGGPADLRVRPAAAYATDQDRIPTGELVDVPAAPWDHCFVGLASDPVVTWPGALELSISSSFDHWVIFTEPENALCVEPQSGPPNQLNRDPVVLEANETFTGSMTWSWRRL